MHDNQDLSAGELADVKRLRLVWDSEASKHQRQEFQAALQTILEKSPEIAPALARLSTALLELTSVSEQLLTVATALAQGNLADPSAPKPQPPRDSLPGTIRSHESVD